MDVVVFDQENIPHEISVHDNEEDHLKIANIATGKDKPEVSHKRGQLPHLTLSLLSCAASVMDKYVPYSDTSNIDIEKRRENIKRKMKHVALKKPKRKKGKRGF